MNSLASQKNMFDRIEDPTELRKIWTDVFASKVEIQVKIGNLDKILLLGAKVQSDKIHCTVTPAQDLSKEGKHDIIGQFSVGGDKYFFQSPWTYENAHVAVALRTSLYKLQRRQNYRLKVPESFVAQFNIKTLNDRPNHTKVKMHDLSSGGCLLMTSNEAVLQQNDRLSAEMILGKRDPLAVEAVIRHVRVETNENKKYFLVGVQFEMTPALESQLFTVMMELSRKYLKA